MLAETFLEEFGRLAAGTDGVRKLRELVLNLAISGRLSDRRPEDGHAQALVEAAAIAIRSAVESGEIRKPRYFGKAEDRTPTNLIPANWVTTCLGDLGLISPRNEAPDEAAAGFVPMAEIEAKFGLPHGFEERKWADIKSGYTHVANGDVVLAKITPCFENGKSAAITGLPNQLGAGTTELHVFRQLGHVVELDYVLAFLKSESFIQAGAPRMTGTAGQKRVPADYFALSPFPLPPLAEQKRIVAKVNELMTLCDELEARQAKETKLKRTAVASALHHLAEAKTPEETTGRWTLLGQRFSELFDDLETIKALREVLIELALQGRFTSSIGISQWPKKIFSEVAEIRSGVTKGRKLQGAEIISVPYLRVANVQRGFVDTKEVKSIEIGAHELDRFSLRRGDVLQIEGGDWDKVGRAALWNGEIDPCVHQNHVFSSRPADGLMPEFVVLWMNSPETKRYFISCSKQTTNLASINKTQLSNTPIVVPPLAEQKRIVAKVDELMALCDRLEEQVREGERLSFELMASMVHALTETDPDGGGAVEPVSFAADAPTIAAPEQASMNSPEAPGTKSARTASKPKPDTKIRISVCDGMSWLSCCPCPAMPVRLRISASAPTIPERLPAIPSLSKPQDDSACLTSFGSFRSSYGMPLSERMCLQIISITHLQ
jgi:type I restriction enzyme S subunit